MRTARRVQTNQAPVVVDDVQPSTHVDRRSGDHASSVDQGELRGPAADVDVEDPGWMVVGDQRRSGAVGGEHRLHVVAGAGADEVAGLVGDDLGDPAGVAPAERLTGQDHDAGVDVLRSLVSIRVGVVDDRAEGVGVDQGLVDVRRQRDLRTGTGCRAAPRRTGS